MESTKQSCQKQISDGKKRKMASTSSDDRLSALPDCVLAHILSFLSTKLSVSTSILGKRWRFLWSQVPTLDFHSDDYRKTEIALSKIINKVMMLHKVTNLDTFRLYHEDTCCDFEFEAWIATLLDRNVRNLNISQKYYMKVPLCLFNCKTLVELTLTGWSVYTYTGPVCLPALKKLHFSGVTKEGLPHLLPHLLSGCPVLERFLIEMGSPESKAVVSCHIPSPILNNLVLISEDRAVLEVKLDTPALIYLKLCGTMSKVSAGALPSLVEADINFQNNKMFKGFGLISRYYIERGFSSTVIEFVGKLYNVKCLKLRTPELKVCSSAFSALTIKFNNLTELKLATDARFIQRFLENADNLQVLTILKVYGYLNWTDPTQVPACLASHLRTVRIHSVECTEQELSMMRYILRNAKVLEMMGIRSSDGIDKLQTITKISTFQRGSETCQVVFR